MEEEIAIGDRQYLVSQSQSLANNSNVEENSLLTLTEQGLYCLIGDFHIDPWNPVPRAVITHAHADHARWGCERYLTSQEGKHVLQTRMGPNAVIDTLA